MDESAKLIPIIIGIGAVVFFAMWWMGGNSEKACAAYAERTLPLFARGPRHHQNGDQIGWVKDTVCTEWRNVDPTVKEFKWPDPVY